MKVQAINQVQVQTEDKYRFLRRMLRGNAAFSIISGLTLLFGSRPAAEFTGLAWPAALAVTGALLILYGGDLLWVASRPKIDHRLAWTAVILDVLWVAGSYALLLGGWLPLTLAGKWAIALIAELVAAFAILQTIGIRRSR